MSENLDQLEETQESYPNLPMINDVRWQQSIVYPKLDTCVEIRKLPRTALSPAIVSVSRGENIAVMHQVRHLSWIAAKMGNQVGWIDTAFTRFEMLGQSQTPTQTSVIEHDIPETLMAHMQAIGAVFETTEEPLVMMTQSEFDSILQALKGIANTMKKAKERSTIEYEPTQ